MKRTFTALTVAGLLAAACGAGLAQQYNPPTNNRSGGTTVPQTYTPTPPPYSPNPNPSQSNPDPTGLMLAAFGAAAAFGHVMRQKHRTA